MPQFYDPKNPAHVLLDPRDPFFKLPFAEVEKIQKEMKDYLQRREAGKARTIHPALQQVRAQFRDRLKVEFTAGKEGKPSQEHKELIESMVKAMGKVESEYDEQTESGLNDYLREIAGWKNRHARELKLIREVPRYANIMFFLVEGPGLGRVAQKAGEKPTSLGRARTPVHRGDLTVKFKKLRRKLDELGLLETDKIKFSDKGKEYLRQLGAYGPEEKKLRPLSKDTLRRGQARVARRKKQIEKIEAIEAKINARVDTRLRQSTSKPLASLNEKQREMVLAHNKDIAYQMNRLRRAVALRAQLEDDKTMIEMILQHRINFLPASEVSEADLQRLASETRYISGEGKIEDVIPMQTGKYAFLPMRDIPIDYLVWVAIGARINKVDKKKHPAGFEIHVDRKEQIKFAPYVFRRIREYLNSPDGRRRLQQYYGTGLIMGKGIADKIRDMGQPAGQKEMDRSMRVQNELRAQHNVPALQKQLQRAMQRLDAEIKLRKSKTFRDKDKKGQRGALDDLWQRFLHEDVLEGGLSAEEAQRYVRRAMKEADLRNQEAWRTPEAWAEHGLSEEERKAFMNENAEIEKELLLRKMHTMTREAFQAVMWPELPDKEARLEYFRLRAKILQTSKEEKAGFRYARAESRKLQTGAGPWYPLLRILEEAWAIELKRKMPFEERRRQLDALRSRVIEMYHERGDMVEDAQLRLDMQAAGLSEEERHEIEMQGYEAWHDSPMVRYVHNELTNIANKFAHPDIVPDVTEGSGLPGEEPPLPFPEDHKELGGMSINEEWGNWVKQESEEIPSVTRNVPRSVRTMMGSVSPNPVDEMADDLDIAAYHDYQRQSEATPNDIFRYRTYGARSPEEFRP